MYIVKKHHRLKKICGVKCSVLERVRWKKTTIGILVASAPKHAALGSKSKDSWLAWKQDNVFEWSDMSTYDLLFQWTNTVKIQLNVLVQWKVDSIIISFT